MFRTRHYLQFGHVKNKSIHLTVNEEQPTTNGRYVIGGGTDEDMDRDLAKLFE